MNNQSKDQIQIQLDKISPSLRAFALKLTTNSMDAEDLYQDTAFRIFTNAEKYHAGTNFKAWAVTIMRNIFINNYRKKLRRNLVIDQTPNNYLLDSGTEAIPNDGETSLELTELIGMVETLPEDFRKPFIMAFEGSSTKRLPKNWARPLAP